MMHEPLGLFDSSPSSSDTRAALACAALLLCACAIILPFSSARLPQEPAFVPVVDAVIFVGEVIIASLLYAQAAIFGSRALNLLASVFVFMPLMLVPHALTFPGAFHSVNLGAGSSAAAWAMVFRRMAFPIVVIAFAWMEGRQAAGDGALRLRPAHTLAWIGGAVAVAAIASILSFTAERSLPAFFTPDNRAIASSVTTFNIANMSLLVLGMALLWHARRSVLTLWLGVALIGWLLQTVVNWPSHTRFTLGWYSLYLVTVGAHLMVLVALLVAANRLYARLALATAARERERDARLMSMEAVAAAISHEVGQTLAAANLSASAGLQSLAAVQPEATTAIKSLGDVIEAGSRSFEAIRSTRKSFGQLTDTLSEFSLNELALECASSFEWEFAARRIALHHDLDPALPTILANRVQVRRVLVALLTNAVDALGRVRAETRSLTLRSHASAGDVLLEIGDTGSGIAAEDMERIFEPFFTTKETGSGLGLSLAETIVREHGGRLWVTSEAESGATFHVRLPSSRGDAASRRGGLDDESGPGMTIP